MLTALPIDYVAAPTAGPEYLAQQQRQADAALLGAGSGRQLGARSGLRAGASASTVTATTAAWTVNEFAAIIDLAIGARVGAYRVANDAAITGAMNPADQNSARIDTLFVQINDKAVDNTNSEPPTIVYVAGSTATGTAPAAPNNRCWRLADINVPKLGAGNPAVTLTTQRSVAAGGVVPLDSQADEDGVTKSDGLVTATRVTKRVRAWFSGKGYDLIDPYEVQSGSTVLATLADGTFTIAFPHAFAAAPIVTAVSGDYGAAEGYVVSTSRVTNRPPDSFSAVLTRGTERAINATVRIDWIAHGLRA